MGMNTKGIAVFLILAFGIAWLIWSLPILMRVPVTSTAFQWWILPGAFAPAFAGRLAFVAAFGLVVWVCWRRSTGRPL